MVTLVPHSTFSLYSYAKNERQEWFGINDECPGLGELETHIPHHSLFFFFFPMPNLSTLLQFINNLCSFYGNKYDYLVILKFICKFSRLTGRKNVYSIFLMSDCDGFILL